MTGIQSKVARGFRGSAGPATKALGSEVNSNSGAFQSAVGKLGGIAKTGGIAIAAGLTAGAVGIAALTGKALMAGAELEQQLGGAEAVFGEFAGSIKKSAEEAYSVAGLSQTEFLQGANKMGSLFQGAGFEVEESMKMTQESMQRASDIASIMGISTTEALEAVTGMAKGNLTMMDNLGVAMNDTVLNAFALEKGLGKTTQQMSVQEKVGLANQLFLEKTSKFAGNYAKENDTLSGSLNTTKKAFDNLLAGEGDIGDFIDSLLGTIDLAVPKIVEILPKLVQGLGALLPALVGAFQQALPVLIPAIIDAAKNLVQALVTAMPTVVSVLLQALPTLINAFIELFLAIILALPEIVKIIGEAMPTIIDALVGGLTAPEALEAIILGAVELLLAIVDAIPIIIPALLNALPIILRNLIQTLTSSRFISSLIGASVRLMQSIVTGIFRVLGSVKGAAKEIFNVIKETLGFQNLKRIGTDVVKGLWDGIQGMGDWIKDKIISFVSDKIPGPVKKVLGISSPSKLFAEFGRNIDEGLVRGIDKHAGKVENAVNNMANSAIAGMVQPSINPTLAFGTTGASAGGAGGGITNQAVNINKIVLSDETAVKEFFRQLNQDTMNVGRGITPNQGAV